MRRDPAGLGPGGVVRDAGQEPPDAGRAAQHGLLDQQIRLGNDAAHLSVRVEDGERADPAFAEPAGYLPERRGLENRYRKRGHDVPDDRLHCHHPALSFLIAPSLKSRES